MSSSPLDSQDGIHRTRISGEMKNNEVHKLMADQQALKKLQEDEKTKKIESIQGSGNQKDIDPDAEKQQNSKKKNKTSFEGGSFLDTSA